MDSLRNMVEPIRTMQIRPVLAQIITLGMILTSALIMWKGLIVVTGSESPVVVVLSESMEPGFRRGDILFLHMNKEPIRTREIIVFNVEGRDIPIVHRVIKVVSYLGRVRLGWPALSQWHCSREQCSQTEQFMNAMIQPNLIFSQKVTITVRMTEWECCMQMGSFGFSDSTLLDGLLASCLMLGGLQSP